MSGNSKNYGYLAFLVILGAISGTFIGEVLSQNFNISFFQKVYNIGLSKPLLLDLKILKLTFGINFNVNVMTIVGVILVILVYRKN